jgi:hypothetical protein
MEITINAIELASELAHEIVCAKLQDDDNAIYEDPLSAVTSYTDEAQDLFNEWYDYYLTKIESTKI